MNRCAGAITRTMKVPEPGAEMFKVIVPLETGQRIGQSLMRLCCTLSSCAPNHLHPEPSTENSHIYLEENFPPNCSVCTMFAMCLPE